MIVNNNVINGLKIFANVEITPIVEQFFDPFNLNVSIKVK
jgi:hypothetical protein